MKFEKLNENKIRITISSKDLIEKNIDFNSILSNSSETQDLFLNVLEEAEEKVGFVTKDHKIKIEALAMADGDFVLTVTRFEKKEYDESYQIQKNKKLKVKRKQTRLSTENLVYSFNTFDDFCLFSSYVEKIKNYNTISKTTVLYSYNDMYYLVFSKLNLNHPYIKKFYTFITEFATYINNSDLFYYKLSERGKIILKNNAIKQCLKYFN